MCVQKTKWVYTAPKHTVAE